MTYFGFLAIFLGIPILIVGSLLYVDQKNGRHIPASFRNWAPWAAVLLHVVIAVVYTTPWDNYLVATRVWWYDPALVTGITFGWVPIEEYTFFVVQPILGGMWLLWLLRRVPAGDEAPANGENIRRRAGGVVFAVWALSVLVLASPWEAGTYLGLELVWALPPITLQLMFGADILWQHRRIVLLSIAPLTLFLSAADALAIGWGTWTINPAQSVDFLIGGVLPIEEFFFFLLTNILITFGVVLVLSPQSRTRFNALLRRQTWIGRLLPGSS